jgi:hypothetical protein
MLKFSFFCVFDDFQVLCTPSPQGRKLPQEEVWPQQRGETSFLINFCHRRHHQIIIEITGTLIVFC